MEDYLQMSSVFPMPSSFVHNSGFIKNGDSGDFPQVIDLTLFSFLISPLSQRELSLCMEHHKSFTLMCY